MQNTPLRLASSMRTLLIVTIITGLLLLFVEGLVSVGLALSDAFKAGSALSVSQYDADLGWTGKPNIHIPDMYGQGRDVRLNSQGFRHDYEINEAVAQDKVRFICTGNSFTFGEGVSDGQEWCSILAELDSRIEPVNMGQPGYGIDQAYLRYMRDATTLEHSVHLFAFIGFDVERIQHRAHHGYGKPILRIDNEDLRTENVPVPQFRPWLSRGFRSVAKELRLFELLKRAVRRGGGGGGVPEAVNDVGRGIFSSLDRWHEHRSTMLILVYLPVEAEYIGDSEWHSWASAEAKRQGLLFVDLLPKLQQLPEDLVGTYFIQRGPHAGHFSPTGNRWAAEAIHDNLQGFPEIRLLLNARESRNE